ncbi:MAG TPA: hypothetical protein VMT57_06860 [Candidatus Thermoplasmatota archaeon]|nr:hypothetical protein [Candidatus Thermoplasmatota archaeon]
MNVTENEEEYTGYVKAVAGTRVTMLSLFSGFTFTITLFLNQLPDPTDFISQLTLFFLVLLFDMSLFLLAWQTIIMIGTWNVREVLGHAKWELSVFNLLLVLVFILWGWLVVLLFLMRNLTFLTLTSGILWLIVIIAVLVVFRGTVKRLVWSVKAELKTITGKQ